MQLRATRAMVRPDDRIVAGVAGALAAFLHLPRIVVRIGLVASAFGGFGIAFYLLCWALIPGPGDTSALAERLHPRDLLDLLAISAVAAGIAEVMAVAGLLPPGRIAIPLVLGGAGLVLLGGLVRDATDEFTPSPTRRAPVHLPDWVPPGAAAAVDVLGTRRALLARAIVGALFVVGGIALLLGATGSLPALRTAGIAVAAIAFGLALGFGPWLWRLGTELVTERRERIRSDERAEVAAHLHDSVLQTLAMVQRRADDPREVVRLARKQERELRTWLLSGRTADADTPAGSLGAAVAALGAELEDTNGIPVEIVQVRDCDLDERIQPLLLAAREAIANAQRHSGAPRVSVYCEVDPERVELFVRDRGHGFDRAQVAADRRGIAESIEGRMARHGGQATVRTNPGEGTEVALAMPRSTP